MFGSFGGTEIIIILGVVLLFFGAKRIPELARGIGQGINEFKKVSEESEKKIEKDQQESDKVGSQDS